MSSFKYIKRHLSYKDRTIPEDQLFDLSNCIVVLAEPGAGKTELLSSLAKMQNTLRTRANVFLHKPPAKQDVLLIDGLDEVARIDNSAIEKILAKVSALDPKRIVFASRASEWDDNRYSRLIHDFMGTESTTVHLLAFDEIEQRALFDSIFPNEDFNCFLSQVENFEIAPLLGNPLFLTIFASAYIQNNRRFESKKSMFSDAVRYLAEEHNLDLPKENRPNSEDIISITEEVFAKLLLSGAAGVSSIESTSDRSFPFLYTISSTERYQLRHMMDSGLFKLADNASQHEPVHRVVAEFCAANYLARRLRDSADQLTLKSCLSIVAPNGTVRDELRGLLGWLATLGDEETRSESIKLDPYSIIANGDPSQLSRTSKKQLLSSLDKLASIDPYFRLSDRWRSFNASGFFTGDIVDDVAVLIANKTRTSHLPELLLELLQSSNVNSMFEGVLESIALDSEISLSRRQLACINLVLIDDRNHCAAFDALLNEGGYDAINLATELVNKLSAKHFGRARLLSLLRAQSLLYSSSRVPLQRSTKSKYFIKQMIGSFDDIEVVSGLLDELTKDLKCTCNAEHDFQCVCRGGVSKIIGRLLDRYFEIVNAPFDPVLVWTWMKALIFHSRPARDSSHAVSTLQSDDSLRQAIQLIAFKGLSDPDEIWNQRCYFLSNHGHSGLFFQQADYLNIVGHAFITGNPVLWRTFYQDHSRYTQQKEPNQLRAIMRIHAGLKAEFMYEWARRTNQTKQQKKTDIIPRYRSDRQRKRRENRIHKENWRHLNNNRSLITEGRHFGWLRLFAENYLHKPGKLPIGVDDSALPETALRNCLPFIEPDLPTLSQLADLSTKNRGRDRVSILQAACLAIFQHSGSLSSISKHSLEVLKADDGVNHLDLDETEKHAFEAELNKCLFKSNADIEAFSRSYIEPQLAVSGDHYVHVDWFRYKPEFKHLCSTLPLEWLMRFPKMPFTAMGNLFSFCAEHGDQKGLKDLISKRCHDIRNGSLGEVDENERKFWYIRSFFFIKEGCEFAWTELSQSADTIFILEGLTTHYSRNSDEHWPTLGAEKVFKILDAFVDKWPKVELPSNWGTGDPEEEVAYRYQTKIIHRIEDDEPSVSLSVLDRLLADQRFLHFHNTALHMRASIQKTLALRDFEPPSPHEITQFLDEDRIASVEGLRVRLVEELTQLQTWLKGAETDPLDTFYNDLQRVDENTARNRIVERLQPRFASLDVLMPIERNMAKSKRCDFTAEISTNGQQHMLVVEVKGQWHPELYNAAKEQLYDRYAHHPCAAHQGIYLVLWFGANEKIAGRKLHGISGPAELQKKIEEAMPAEVKGRVDVFVLDLSRLEITV
tara:strand:- start:510 stop:4526 length:4017 start_codon:yes stop_codon:yes gene_type:complete